MPTEYEYSYSNVSFIADLQAWMASGRAFPQLAGLNIVGASADHSGYASIIFSTELTNNQRNRLLNFVRNRDPGAIYEGMVEVEDDG